MRSVNVLVLALTIFAVPAAAQIYQWRDADGRVHFSDLPPPNEEAKVLRGKSGGPAPAPAPAEEGATDAADAPAAQAQQPKTLADKELEFRQRRTEAAEIAAKTQEEKERAAERERDCERARNQLAALTSGQRIARPNSKGEREYLDDATRAAEIDRAQQYIAKTCK